MNRLDTALFGRQVVTRTVECVNTLSQWGALEVLAQSPDADPYAELLDVDATWWVDEHGAAHGDASHTQGGELVRGTLRELTQLARHKKCATVARVAGDTGVEAASRAQQLTEGLSGLERIESEAGAHPVIAALKAEALIDKLTDSDLHGTPIGRAALARAERVRSEALMRARSDEARALLRLVAIRSILERTPDTPLTRLHALISNTWASSLLGLSYLGSVADATYDQEWADRITSQVPASTPQALDVLRQIDQKRLATRIEAGEDALDAAVSLWRQLVMDTVDEVVIWAAATRDQLSADSSVSLLVSAPATRNSFEVEALGAYSSGEDLRALLEKGVHVVPSVLAQAVVLHTRGATCARVSTETLEGLGDREWHALETLSSDARWQDVEVEETLRVAMALTRSDEREVKMTQARAGVRGSGSDHGYVGARP